MKKLLLILVLLIAPCFAAEDYYTFETPLQKQRFDALTAQFRCLVCQNQTIAESNATLASDLRGQVFQKIIKGQTDKEIIDYLVARYGDFILYNPPLNALTIGLWFGPIIIFIFGLSYLFYYVRKRQRQ